MKNYSSLNIEHYCQKMIFSFPGEPHQNLFLPVLNDLIVLQQARLRQKKNSPQSPSAFEESEEKDLNHEQALSHSSSDEDANEDYHCFSSEDDPDESKIKIEEIGDLVAAGNQLPGNNIEEKTENLDGLPLQQPGAPDIEAFHHALFRAATQTKPLPGAKLWLDCLFWENKATLMLRFFQQCRTMQSRALLCRQAQLDAILASPYYLHKVKQLPLEKTGAFYRGCYFLNFNLKEDDNFPAPEHIAPETVGIFYLDANGQYQPVAVNDKARVCQELKRLNFDESFKAPLTPHQIAKLFTQNGDHQPDDELTLLSLRLANWGLEELALQLHQSIKESFLRQIIDENDIKRKQKEEQTLPAGQRWSDSPPMIWNVRYAANPTDWVDENEVILIAEDEELRVMFQHYVAYADYCNSQFLEEINYALYPADEAKLREFIIKCQQEQLACEELIYVLGEQSNAWKTDYLNLRAEQIEKYVELASSSIWQELHAANSQKSELVNIIPLAYQQIVTARGIEALLPWVRSTDREALALLGKNEAITEHDIAYPSLKKLMSLYLPIEETKLPHPRHANLAPLYLEKAKKLVLRYVLHDNLPKGSIRTALENYPEAWSNLCRMESSTYELLYQFLLLGADFKAMGGKLPNVPTLIDATKAMGQFEEMRLNLFKRQMKLTELDELVAKWESVEAQLNQFIPAISSQLGNRLFLHDCGKEAESLRQFIISKHKKLEALKNKTSKYYENVRCLLNEMQGYHTQFQAKIEGARRFHLDDELLSQVALMTRYARYVNNFGCIPSDCKGQLNKFHRLYRHYQNMDSKKVLMSKDKKEYLTILRAESKWVKNYAAKGKEAIVAYQHAIEGILTLLDDFHQRIFNQEERIRLVMDNYEKELAANKQYMEEKLKESSDNFGMERKLREEAQHAVEKKLEATEKKLEAERQLREEAQREMERKLEEKSQETERKLEEKSRETERKLEEKTRETERRLEEKDRETEKKLRAERQLREEAQREMERKFEEMQTMVFRMMQKMTEAETSPAKPTIESKEVAELNGIKVNTLVKTSKENEEAGTSFARSGEGLFTLPESLGEEKQEQIDNMVAQTANEIIILSKEEQKPVSSLTN